MSEKKYFMRNNGSGAILEVIGKHESGDYMCNWIFNTGTGFRYHPYEFEKEFVPIDSAIVDKLERQRCGRRGEGVATLEKEPLPDFWKEIDGVKKCSFCGSLHPMSLIEIIKEKGFGIIHPSDKSYKWYVDGYNKYYRMHDTPEFIDQYNSLVTQSKNPDSL
jgi:hypothetical protein